MMIEVPQVSPPSASSSSASSSDDESSSGDSSSGSSSSKMEIDYGDEDDDKGSLSYLKT